MNAKPVLLNIIQQKNLYLLDVYQVIQNMMLQHLLVVKQIMNVMLGFFVNQFVLLLVPLLNFAMIRDQLLLLVKKKVVIQLVLLINTVKEEYVNQNVNVIKMEVILNFSVPPLDQIVINVMLVLVINVFLIYVIMLLLLI